MQGGGMMLILKILALLLCALALIVTFRTENVLRAVFRVESPDKDLILKTKTITLCVTIILFAVVMIVFR